MELPTIKEFKGVLSNKNIWYRVGAVIASFGAALTMRKVLDVVWRKVHNYPPGPVGIPILGSLSEIYYYSNVLSLTNSYGSVVMVYFGFRKLVFINDIKLTKQFFNSAEGAKRDNYQFVKHISNIAEVYGKEYKIRRQLLHKSLTTVLDSNYLNNVGIKILTGNLFQTLDKAAMDDTSVNLRRELKYAVFALLFSTIFGDYLQIPLQGSETYKSFTKHLDAAFQDFSRLDIDKEIFKGFPGWDNFVRHYRRKVNYTNWCQIQTLVDKWVDATLEIKNNSDTVKGASINKMIDAFAKGTISESALKSDAMSILIGGIHTTSMFMGIALVFLAKDQNMQELVYKELKTFQAKHGQFVLKHAAEFPLLRALLHETLRFASINPMSGLPRVVHDDNVKIGGYSIPRNTIVRAFSANFMHREHDENIKWCNVKKFDLNNFLDLDGKFVLNPAFSAFGIGRRNCPGSSLAKREIYILLGRTLLRYKIRPESDAKYDDVNMSMDLDLEFPDPDPRFVWMRKLVKVERR